MVAIWESDENETIKTYFGGRVAAEALRGGGDEVAEAVMDEGGLKPAGGGGPRGPGGGWMPPALGGSVGAFGAGGGGPEKVLGEVTGVEGDDSWMDEPDDDAMAVKKGSKKKEKKDKKPKKK